MKMILYEQLCLSSLLLLTIHSIHNACLLLEGVASSLPLYHSDAGSLHSENQPTLLLHTPDQQKPKQGLNCLLYH